MRLPLIVSTIEVPHVWRQAVRETITCVLLTIATYRETCVVYFLHSLSFPVQGEPRGLAFVKCHVATGCVLVSHFKPRILIEMMVVDLILSKVAFLFCKQNTTNNYRGVKREIYAIALCLSRVSRYDCKLGRPHAFEKLKSWKSTDVPQPNVLNHNLTQ